MMKVQYVKVWDCAPQLLPKACWWMWRQQRFPTPYINSILYFFRTASGLLKPLGSNPMLLRTFLRVAFFGPLQMILFQHIPFIFFPKDEVTILNICKTQLLLLKRVRYQLRGVLLNLCFLC